MNIKNICDISKKYDFYLIDLVGVIHDGKNALPQAVETINKLIDQQKQIIFLSNNPRPASFSYPKLLDMGIKDCFNICTSGDYTRHILNTEYLNKKIFHLGYKRNTEISENLPHEFVTNVSDSEVILLSLFIEEDENPDEYNDILKEIAQSKKPVLCANPDIQAFYGNTIRLCAGYFSQKISALGHDVRIMGKPSPDIYKYCFSIFPKLTNQKNRIIMIGDTLETDILGANLFDLDSLLVKSGITGYTYKDSVDEHIKQNLINPTYIMDFLHF